MSPQAQSEALTYRCPHCQASVQVNALEAGETLRCPSPACGKPFKVELPAAQPVAAPVAAVVPDGGRPQNPAPAAVPVPVTHAGVAEPVRAVDREEAVARVRLSMWRRYPIRCLVYVVALIAGLVGAIVALINGWTFTALLCGAASLLAALRFIPWWARMSATTLVITNVRFILESGVLKRDATELRRDQIGDLQVRQDLFMRWLDVGDLVITSNTGDRKQLLVMAVPSPERVAEHLTAPKVVATQAETPSAAPVEEVA